MKSYTGLTLLATTVLLAGCGSSGTGTTDNETVTPPASSAAAANSSVPTPSPMPSATSSYEAQPDLVEVTTTFPVGKEVAADEKIGILVSPTGNIGCDIWAVEGLARCGVKSYYDEAKYPTGDITGPAWVFALDDELDEVSLNSRGDAMFFMMGEHEGNAPQVVEYGTTATYGSIECRSEEEAMTCTNTKTGHGVTMSREGYSTF
ncbi:hypothetical protein [Rothia endophytica]|uniref:Lipoprotein n=1 Tax=Rothia endophytica TaxID=1324766 RepID=A0ABP9B7Q5_9MICC